MTLTQYLLTNLYMGAGIAADVYAATIGSFREFADDTYRRNWVRRNAITHTLFPLVGMYSVIIGIATWPPLQSILFGLGALLLGTFLWNLIREKAGLDSDEKPELKETQKNDMLSKLRSRFLAWLANIDPQWVLVLGVSVDAINSGFAKAADTRNWSLPELLLSFPLVGLVVGTGAWVGGQKAKWFLGLLSKKSTAMDDNKKTYLSPAQRLARLEFIALLIEILVLGYFFLRSVASVFVPFNVASWVDSRGLAWATSAFILILITSFFGRAIRQNLYSSAVVSFRESDA
jgi:hypothetical protein